MRQQLTIAKVLLALSEEPSWIEALSARLPANRGSVRKAVGYLHSAELIKFISADFLQGGAPDMRAMVGQEVYAKVKAKINKVKDCINSKLATSTVERMRVYYLTKKGAGYLDIASEILCLRYYGRRTLQENETKSNN